jgi:hypothetical protein
MVVVVLVSAAGAVVVWRAPAVYEWLFPRHTWRGWKPADQAAAVGQRRLAFVQGTAALGGAIALAYTARNYRLSRQGQWTERFTKALERLDSPSIYARVGGIRALEHVLRESARHHNDIVEVLVAFIRHQVPAAKTSKDPDDGIPRPTEPAADVQAALTVLCQRPRRREHGPLHLAGLHLAGARLFLANLADASLSGTDLTNAVLGKVNLYGARLATANLTNASLIEVDLRRADLRLANLSGAKVNARLKHADLSGARVRSKTRLPAGWVRGEDGQVSLESGWEWDWHPVRSRPGGGPMVGGARRLRRLKQTARAGREGW